jgi:hypothetical protein
MSAATTTDNTTQRERERERERGEDGGDQRKRTMRGRERGFREELGQSRF